MDKIPPVCARCLRLIDGSAWVVMTGGLVVCLRDECQRSAQRAHGGKVEVWGMSRPARAGYQKAVRLSPREQMLHRAQQFQPLPNPGRPTIEEITMHVCDYFRVEPAELRGPRRTRSLSYARHIAMYVIREATDHSLPEVGAWFGGRDHTSVLYAVEKINELRTSTRTTREHVAAIYNRVLVHRTTHRA